MDIKDKRSRKNSKEGYSIIAPVLIAPVYVRSMQSRSISQDRELSILGREFDLESYPSVLFTYVVTRYSTLLFHRLLRR